MSFAQGSQTIMVSEIGARETKRRFRSSGLYLLGYFKKINDSPIEQVRLTVPITDDVSLPTLTFRVWLLGIPICVFLAFINQLFLYRQNRIIVPTSVAQMAVLPVGKLLARILPTKVIKIPRTNWQFSLNPGPFNIKEHVLISILASPGGYGPPYPMEIISQMKIFYHQEINPLAAFLLMITTKMLGFGFAGMCTKLLVESPYMWWPNTLINISFFRALHDTEARRKGELTKLQFFLVVTVLSFAYYIVPNYFFPSITALSFVCWVWKNSVTAQQIGSCRHGLGIGSFSLDWPSISYVGDPLAYPMFAIINIMAGFILVMYVATPVAYWTNLYNAKRFPIFSADLFDAKGNKYNISRILDENFEFDQRAYDNYSKLHLSTFYALNYGFIFASVTASLMHTALFHGRTIWHQIKEARGDQHLTADIHNRMMKNYDPIPQYWFFIILISMLGLSIFTCEGFGGQLQLPFWGFLLACALLVVFIIPLAMIQATSNQGLSIVAIADLTIGYLYPGRPIANMVFKAYSSISLVNAVDFLNDLKQAHYMKIPPRSMFIAQVVGPLVSTSVGLGTALWIFSTVDNICNPAKLPKGSPWTCPFENVAFSLSGIWGVVGPARMFVPLGIYGKLYLFFLLGPLATMLVWGLSRVFPEKKWITLINMPLIFGATGFMPMVTAGQFLSFFIVGFLFNFIVYRKYKGWWAKYTYILSCGLTTGVAFMALLVGFALSNVYGVNWWGLELDDHCTLAHCPTAPGVVVDGCPVFQ